MEKSYRKKPHSMAIFLINVRRTYRDLSSQTDPARDNWTWSCTYFSLNSRFALDENTITHAWGILTRLDIKFHANAWGFHHGVTWINELQWEVLTSIQNVKCSVSRILVNNFCTYCSNFERNPSFNSFWFPLFNLPWTIYHFCRFASTVCPNDFAWK